MKKKVLVVDDEESFRNLVKRQLKKQGYETIEASNYLEALSLTKECDFIILDLFIGQPDGEALLRKIREERNFVPVIVVSGYKPKSELIETLEKLGALYFILKPVRLSKLIEYINRAINLNEQIDKIEQSGIRLDDWIKRQEQKFGVQLLPIGA
jgi:two-component system alkaline phosphatase synthesis response regulator PhoP